jgi:vacuolar-type H+-ATPase subunit F/Vma7
MPQPVYLGDEVTAAGYRLAGVRAYTPQEHELVASLKLARSEASLIMLSARLARALPAAELDRLLAGVTPPVLVVEDVSGAAPLPDLATRLRHELGMLE